jgi:Flp pilus assembly pilin Flp
MRARQSRFRNALRRLWQDRSGATILEFAMVLPPLCLILVGMFEVAMVTFCQASMEGALREAARYGMTGRDNATPADREAKILEIVDDYTLGLFDIDDPNLSSSYKTYTDFNSAKVAEPLTYDANGNGSYDAGDQYSDTNGNGVWDGDDGDAGLGAAEQIVEYTVEYDWPLMTPFMARIMGNAEGKIPLKASIVLRNEPWDIEEGS